MQLCEKKHQSKKLMLLSGNYLSLISFTVKMQPISNLIFYLPVCCIQQFQSDQICSRHLNPEWNTD